MQILTREKKQGRFRTGRLKLKEKAPPLIDLMNPVDTPLAHLPENRIKPSRETLEKILNDYR